MKSLDVSDEAQQDRVKQLVGDRGAQKQTNLFEHYYILVCPWVPEGIRDQFKD